VSGKGKAIVCAVGERTQFGLPVDIDIDISLEKKKTPFKEKLEQYSHVMGGYTNSIIMFLILMIIVRSALEFYRIIPSHFDYDSKRDY
jgi:magnesium-transporting ATPase (P-type)